MASPIIIIYVIFYIEFIYLSISNKADQQKQQTTLLKLDLSSVSSMYTPLLSILHNISNIFNNCFAALSTV